MNDNSINWKSYFDRIFCIFYLPYQSHKTRLELELARVGILDSGIFQWKYTFPSRYDKVIQESFIDKKHIKRIAWINESLGLLGIMNESIALGYERILVLEDDVSFLKDKSSIRSILEAMPKGFNVYQFDKALCNDQKILEYKDVVSRPVNDYFADSTGHWFGMGTANAYDKKAMHEVIECIEKKPVAMDTISMYIKCKWAVATKSMCIQCIYRDSTTGIVVAEKGHDNYTRINAKYDDYQLPEGYGKGMLQS